MSTENIKIGSRNIGDLSLCDGEKREEIVRKKILVLSTGQNFTKQDGVEVVFLSGSDFSDPQEREAIIATTNEK